MVGLHQPNATASLPAHSMKATTPRSGGAIGTKRILNLVVQALGSFWPVIDR